MRKFASVCAFVLMACLFIAGIAQEPIQSARDEKEPPKSVNQKQQKPGSNEIGTLSLSDLGLDENDLSRLGLDAVSVAPGTNLGRDIEPNGTVATASPITGNSGRLVGNLFPRGDIDFYSFNAVAGERIYAATMTSFSAGSSTDSQITLIASDGTTTIEFDDDNGSSAALSSTIAGATIPTTGTYYLKVNDFTAGTTSMRPYELWFSRQSGTPTPEIEGNDTPATANPLPTNGWVSGARDPAAATEQDWYSMTLNAGDTVYLGLDLDPERDGVTWNGRLGFALFGDANNQILPVDDAGTGDVSPNPNIPSEAMFMTVKTAGTYYAFVDSASAAVGGPTATYHLNVSVLPKVNEGVNCTTYTSTDVPKTIGPGTGLVSSTITVPGNPRIADLDVNLVLNHALMQDLDVHLRSPANNNNGLFTDIGAAATGGQTQMDTTFDDEAGVPPSFTALRGVQVKPENNSTAGTASTSGAYRLSWFDGENAGGTWTLDIRDDTAGANGGTLTSWGLRICEQPAPPPGITLFSTDFESGAAGFTHSGANDEWELGLPATVATTTANPIAPFDTCNSGVNCWKTDLDSTYNASSNQDLVSPNINLAGIPGPITLKWAMRHQIETANFDNAYVEVRQVGGANPRRVWQWLDPTPISASAGTGNPQENIGGSVGWGDYYADISEFAGQNIEVVFHLDSDTTVQFGGWAIDDVTVTGGLQADLAITKTDGVTTAVPGSSVTYTITASNAGPSAITGATVADTFPAALTNVTWSCVGAGGGTCTASGSGNINQSVNLPAGGSVTYTATATISAAATGTISNTATVTAPASVADPNAANNSATDTDTLTPQANLGITKTDGVTTATPGGSVTYTITASNAGPSNATGATVTDTFPAAVTGVTWTCVGAGGGTCTASGSGNINQTVNLPSGGSVTYTATAAISASATGTLSNTATVTAPAGVTDPTPGNNSATDTDTLTPQADLAITKTDGVTQVTAGGSVTYTITASNAGASNAPGATVADTLPAALTGATWTCVGAGGGTCTASGSGNINQTVNLPAGGSVTYTVSATVAPSASGTLSNTATVSAPAGVTDPNAANNAATDTDTVAQSANLSATVTDAPDPVVTGGNIAYTITVNNAGPSNAANVSLSDSIPANTTFVSLTVPAGWNCTTPAAGAGGAVTCTIADLAAGGSASFTLTVKTAAGLAPNTVISNTATVSSSTSDPTPGNNSATTTTTVVSPAIVAGTKTVSGGPYFVGATVTYTVTLANSGAATQNDNPGNEFVDVLPSGLTLVSANSTSGTTFASPGTNMVAFNGAIPAGGSVTITITATINSGTEGQTISNQGTINYDADGNGTNETSTVTDDPTVAGNNNPTAFVVVAVADLSVTKTASADPATPGANLTYTITVNNAGPSSAASVTLTDALPANTTFVSGTAPAGWNCTTPTIGAGGTVTCTRASFAPGSAVFTITVRVAASFPSGGTIANTATVSSATADPNTANNTATVTVGSVGSADLSLVMTGSVTPVVAGGNLVYTLRVSNNGPSDAAEVVLTNQIPQGTTYQSISFPAGWKCRAPSTPRGNVRCTRVAFAVGDEAVFALRVRVNPTTAAGSTIFNQATVTAATADPNTSNNSGSNTTTVSAGGGSGT